MSTAELKVEEGYVPYYKGQESDPKFENSFKWELVKSFGRLHELLDGVSDQIVGADTETKTLDFSVPRPLVGFSFAFTPYDGYYVPIRHLLGGNLTPKQAVLLFHQFLLRNRVIGFGWPFDAMMLETEPELEIDSNAYRVFDVQSLVFNADTNIKRNNLKWAASYFLGRKVPTFEETVGKGRTFDQISPEEGAYYACCDPANSLGLYYHLLKPLMEECSSIIKIDNALSKAMPFYQRNEVYLDSTEMQKLAVSTTQKIKELELQIFRAVGFPFPIDSKRQLGQALLTIGVDTGLKTSKGDMKLDEKSLSKINHPIVKIVIERNSLVKQLGSYIDKTTKKDTGRFQYKIYAIPTGRIASGNKDTDEDTGNPYFLKLNAQNLTKSEPCYYRVEPGNGPGSILGYEFTIMDPEVYKKEKDLPKDGSVYCEGMSPNMNVRNAVTVPNRDEWYFLGIDFIQEEAQLAADFSKDPVMYPAFERKEDLHKATACAMFGKENYNSHVRRDAKIANFSLLFGGSPWTLEKSSGLPMKRCEEIYETYWNTMRGLNQHIRFCVSQAYRNGGVAFTAYQRPRRLLYWMTSSIPKHKKFGERSVWSHRVQGTAGDVMRIVLIKLWREFLIQYKDVLRFALSVHDELDLCIKKEAFNELVPRLREMMGITPPGLSLPLRTSLEVGYAYGTLFEFELDESGKYVPAVLSLGDE